MYATAKNIKWVSKDKTWFIQEYEEIEGEEYALIFVSYGCYTHCKYYARRDYVDGYRKDVIKLYSKTPEEGKARAKMQTGKKLLDVYELIGYNRFKSENIYGTFLPYEYGQMVRHGWIRHPLDTKKSDKIWVITPDFVSWSKKYLTVQVVEQEVELCLAVT